MRGLELVGGEDLYARLSGGVEVDDETSDGVEIDASRRRDPTDEIRDEHHFACRGDLLVTARQSCLSDFGHVRVDVPLGVRVSSEPQRFSRPHEDLVDRELVYQRSRIAHRSNDVEFRDQELLLNSSRVIEQHLSFESLDSRKVL